MKYLVIRDGKRVPEVKLFLADRNKTKDCWWVEDLINAMQFNKRAAAEYSAKKLIYGNVVVVNEIEANQIEKDNLFWIDT